MDQGNEWPRAGWEDAFRQEATTETMEAAVRCAAIELQRLERLGAVVPWDAEDIVQSVLAATCAGALAWTPGTVTLRAHLRDKIRLLGRRARRRHRVTERAGGAFEIALDHLADDDPTWSDRALSTDDPGRDLVIRDLARRAEADLWRLAAGDPVALRVLTAMTAGHFDLDDIALATKLPPRAVENARRRLRVLAGHLSPKLRTAIRTELELDTSTDDAA